MSTPAAKSPIPNRESPLLVDRIPSPIGPIWVVTQDATLCAVDFEDCENRLLSLLQKRFGEVRLHKADNPGGVSDRLRAYLDGDLHSLDDIPTATGGTDFQQQVWQALRTIPPGQVVTYGELAKQIGRPKAVRAVGMTNGLNPISIVLPCHRVIGANGKLTGYAGGLARKQWLLAHEGFTLGTAAREAQLSLLP
ncbi:MAG: methylated-DNA--[protein]-cysteine S-methyltransferase [Cyanobacteria bacterium P01_D01_bin.44]